MMICNKCLFYESSCIVTEKGLVWGVEYCHYDDGKYNKDSLKFVESILVDECSNFTKSVLPVLSDLEREYNITVLFAVESGSRVWGFSNEDSDFDVRFIFKYNDLKDYLRLDKFKDVITYNEGLLDFVGWDIGKALSLHRKSNPSLREWLLSDTVYVMDYEMIFEDLPVFDKSVLMHHYFGMAYGNWTDFCEGVYDWVGGNDEKRLIKKYLYVIRCILTWHILKETDLNPKINIFELLNQYQMVNNDHTLRKDIVMLLEKYISINNNLNKDNINRLYEYITSNLKQMKQENKKLQTVNKQDIEIYNQRYYQIITKK